MDKKKINLLLNLILVLFLLILLKACTDTGFYLDLYDRYGIHDGASPLGALDFLLSPIGIAATLF